MKEFGLPACQVYQPEIRFVDIDAAGIVNNAVYFNYFEQSRIHFFVGIVGRKWDWNEAGMVVARHEIDYRLPILFNDDVRIITWIEEIGTKSMVAAYELKKRAEGEAKEKEYQEQVAKRKAEFAEKQKKAREEEVR